MWNNHPPIILDATLRDGGYINNWDFSPDQIFMVAEYLELIGIDIIEVGYLNDDQTLNEAYKCTVPLLENLRKRVQRSKIAAMLSPRNKEANKILKTRSGLIDMVRIPFDLSTFDEAINLAKFAQKCGISSSLNFISITALNESELVDAMRSVVSENATDCIYLADSRGTITPEEVSTLVVRIREFWKGHFGFHGHDNLGLALSNSITAIQSGCTLVDGTIDGFGLGGGNTRLDLLMEKMCGFKKLPKGYKKTIKFLSHSLGLTKQSSHMHLYTLSGEKNLEQEWVPILLDKYKDDTTHFLKKIPKKRYKIIEEVLFDGEQNADTQNTIIDIKKK